jgi:hypothetical protein
MGKVVENVVADLQSEDAERRELLSDGQFGSRKGRSAIDAAAIMVDRAHAAWTHAHIRGVLLMNIKAAFPSVAMGSLVNILNVRQMDGDLIRWMENLFTQTTCGDDNRTQWHGQTPRRSRGHSGLTWLTQPLWHLHLRTE